MISNKLSNTEIEKIIMIEGIVIRHIPKLTKSLWGCCDIENTILKSNQKIVNIGNRRFIEEWRENKLHGYCVTVQIDQDSTVNFNKNLDGFGETIEEAYNDYLRKLEKKKETTK